MAGCSELAECQRLHRSAQRNGSIEEYRFSILEQPNAVVRTVFVVHVEGNRDVLPFVEVDPHLGVNVFRTVSNNPIRIVVGQSPI